jgi:hypothetical protein
MKAWNIIPSLVKIDVRLEKLEKLEEVKHLEEEILPNVLYRLEKLENKSSSRIPHKCPICNGTTFNDDGMDCKVCDGNGIVWSP